MLLMRVGALSAWCLSALNAPLPQVHALRQGQQNAPLHQSARRKDFFELLESGTVYVRNASLYARPPPGLDAQSLRARSRASLARFARECGLNSTEANRRAQHPSAPQRHALHPLHRYGPRVTGRLSVCPGSGPYGRWCGCCWRCQPSLPSRNCAKRSRPPLATLTGVACHRHGDDVAVREDDVAVRGDSRDRVAAPWPRLAAE